MQKPLKRVDGDGQPVEDQQPAVVAGEVDAVVAVGKHEGGPGCGREGFETLLDVAGAERGDARFRELLAPGVGGVVGWGENERAARGMGRVDDGLLHLVRSQ